MTVNGPERAFSTANDCATEVRDVVLGWTYCHRIATERVIDDASGRVRRVCPAHAPADEMDGAA